MEVVQQAPWCFVTPRHGPMRVPGVIYATRVLLPPAAGDQALDQVVNVAALPGIVEASYAMPHIHWGYRFPIGGMAATDLAVGGVWPLGRRAELEKVLAGGARYAVEQGHGTGRDLARCEDQGILAGSEPRRVSQRAIDRGLHQVGSLGSGNHFLEVQVVGEVFDPAAAQAFGLAAGVAGGGAFYATCHGAGRLMSRHKAARTITGTVLRDKLEARGIAVRGASLRGLAEETPEAYKDVDEVVSAAAAAGLCRKVARLVPVGVVKG